MLSLLPLKKLSMQTTSFPLLRRCSQRWLPRTPAPPVIRILLIPHSLSPVGHEQEALPLEGGLLGLDDLLDARVGQAEKRGEVLPRKGLPFRRRLDLHELAAVGLDDVHVERGLGILGVVEVQEF